MSGEKQFVKAARIKLSQPLSVGVELNNGKVLRIKGKAAQKPINAIAWAKQSPGYHCTIGLPTPDGETVVVAIDGEKLDATFKR